LVSVVFKKEKTEMGNFKDTKRKLQYKKELKRLGEFTLKTVISILME